MIETSNREIHSHYDFIDVGAGAAGSVLAAELSASGAQVLVVESGGPDEARHSGGRLHDQVVDHRYPSQTKLGITGLTSTWRSDSRLKH
jgi:choline dehydrogenase-like flavoprotein